MSIRALLFIFITAGALHGDALHVRSAAQGDQAYSLDVVPSLGGYVSAPGIDCGGGSRIDCHETYSTIDTIALQAFSSPGYDFISWSGDCAGAANPTSVTVDGPRRCVASFAPSQRSPVPADPAIRGASLMILYPDGMPDKAPVTLWTQIADALTFSSGGGRQFSVSAQGHGSAGNVTFRFPISWGWLLPGVYDEAYSSPNGLFPALVVDGCTPERGRFQIYEVEWTDDGTVTKFAADFEATCQTSTHHVVGAVRYNATRDALWPFDGAYPTYKVVVGPAINGIVTGPGLDCGPGHLDCAKTYPAALTVTLQATPLPGYEFVGWAGDCFGDATTTVIVDFVRRCSAVFNAGRAGNMLEDPSLARSLTLYSSPGDPLGGGRRVVLNDASIIGQLVWETEYVFEAQLPDASRKWTLSFRPGRGVPLPPGSYATPSAQLVVTNPDGQQCGGPPTRFDLYSVRYGWQPVFPRPPRPYLVAFAADFEIRCSADAPPLVGAIRLNSDRSAIVPFPAAAPLVTIVNRDISADGWPDLVWRHATTGANAFWIMNGADMQWSTSFQPAGADVLPSRDWEIRAMGDMNGDGSPDVIWQNTANGQLGVWYFAGTTRIWTDYIYTSFGAIAETDLNWRIVGAGDADRDGQTDLFWQNTATGQLRVWHMYDSRQANCAYISATVGPEWKIVAVADMNGDGWLDLVWQHRGNGGLAVWLMHDTEIVNTLWLTPAAVPDTDWHIVGAADIDRDGNVDLIWQHATNGQLGVWFMRGLELVWARHLNPWMVADPDWRIVAVR